MENYVKANLAAVRARLSSIAKKTGRPAPCVIPVTKSASEEEVKMLLCCDVDGIAENRVPLYRARRELMQSLGHSVPLHLIGSLQTNKVKYVAEDVALIQSLDSLHLAQEIERQGARVGRRIPVLLEVNSASEENKGGVIPDDAYPFVRMLTGGAYPHLLLAGLMTMGPVTDTPEAVRPYFRETKALFDDINGKGLFEVVTPILSMGMSDSYEIAAEEGATMVRIGRALFRH